MATIQQLRRFDKHDMFSVLAGFPSHIEEGLSIGMGLSQLPAMESVRDIAFLGMGGSAIGGDLLRTYMAGIGATERGFVVSRHYDLPAGMRAKTLAIISSYSGNTEETLEAFGKAKKITKNFLCISAGGEVAQRAKKQKLPLVQLPSGFQPRAALGYSFFALLGAMMKAGAFSKKHHTLTTKALEETIATAQKLSHEFQSDDRANNRAFAVAERLKNKAVAEYSSPVFEAVNLRWRGQIQENAKHIAFGGIIPEMNHNEINGWEYPKLGASTLGNKIATILLRDSGDHPRTQHRFDMLRELAGENMGDVIEVQADGAYLLTRMVASIMLADWTSYYLALLHHTDPTEIELILKLKAKLSDLK